jgi:hypothetical protein
VRETPTGLCQLTASYAEGSGKYKALPPIGRAAVNLILNNMCNQLGTIVPKLNSKQLALAAATYNATVKVLTSGGWLTSTQASTLTSLVSNLTLV